jgi:hypothetical protein
LSLIGFCINSGFSFMCMFCWSLFVLLYFFFWPLCCLFFFDIRILIAPKLWNIVSSERYILHMQVLLECCYIWMESLQWENWNHPSLLIGHPPML